MKIKVAAAWGPSLLLLLLSGVSPISGFCTEGQAPGPGPGPGGHRRPPPEALAACEGKASDAECSFVSPHGDKVTGKCWSPDVTRPLACRPPHGGPCKPPAETDEKAHDAAL